MRTITTTKTVYSAPELRGKFPDAFEHARHHYRMWLEQDYHWRSELSGSLAAVLRLLPLRGTDAFFLEGVRAYKWWHNHVLRHFYETPEGVWRTSSGEWVKRPGRAGAEIVLRHCPLTGYCADEDLLDFVKKSLLDGASFDDVRKWLPEEADRLQERDIDASCEPENFIESSECNGWEYDEEGKLV